MTFFERGRDDMTMNDYDQEEVPPVWDFSSLYCGPQDCAIELDMKQSEALATLFQALYKGKVATLSAMELAEAIDHYEKVSVPAGRAWTYRYLVKTVDGNNNDVARALAAIEERLSQITVLTSFFTIEINEISENMMTVLMGTPVLERRRGWLRGIRAALPYMLNEETENMLSLKEDVCGDAWARLYNETVIGLTYHIDGANVCESEIDGIFHSSDRNRRELAATSVGNTLRPNMKLFAFILNMILKDKSIEDDVRGFATPVSDQNLDNEIEDEVVEALSVAVKSSYEDLLHRYYRIKAQSIGLNKMVYWDRAAPLPCGDVHHYSWEESKNIVLDAYREFSPEMADIAQTFFDNGWIDALPKEGKDSGAFSLAGPMGGHPWVLVNHRGFANDVLALAHELGHAIHQTLSARQGGLMSDAALPFAETASIFGEMLVFKKMIKEEKSAEMRKAILVNKIEAMLSTSLRQISYHDFETRIHQERKIGEISVERFNEIWLEISAECFGPDVLLDDNFAMWWARIPHIFESPFYVYSYSFADCVVNSLYANYLTDGEGFVEKYIDMLKSGATKRHNEMLSPFGLDATSSSFWSDGMVMISGLIDELEGL